MYIGNEIFVGRRALWIIASLIAIKLALLFVFAVHSRFVMDEFLQLGYAKYLGHGMFVTVNPPKAVGFAIFYEFAHVIGWNAVSILLAGRIQTTLLGCATLGLVYACARTLGESRLRALAILVVLLSFSNFMERIFRTIAEPLAVFFAVASLLAILRGKPDRARDVVIAGLFGGLAFLATQKSVYFNLALGVALVGDAVIVRRYADGFMRGTSLVAGWLLPLVAYCFIFGGAHPIPIAKSLVFGPVEVATLGGAEYGGLRHYILQTLLRNALPYACCFGGMVLELIRLRQLDNHRRVALIFTMVITALVFAHDQPWPYVFIMALPFMSLWALVPFDRLVHEPRKQRLSLLVLGAAIAIGFVGNVRYLRWGDSAQLQIVERAEALSAPDETYFDGIGMLPNRREPTTLWLDRHYVLKTLREGRNSEAYRVLTQASPKMIIWSYRLDDIYPAVASAIVNSYVKVAPNIRLAGRRVWLGKREIFNVPVAGTYRLYDSAGNPLSGYLEVDGQNANSSVRLERGSHAVVLRSGGASALLVKEGSYAGRFAPGVDDRDLFTGVYD